jgi:hypothetical protein
VVTFGAMPNADPERRDGAGPGLELAERHIGERQDAGPAPNR